MDPVFLLDIELSSLGFRLSDQLHEPRSLFPASLCPYRE